MLSLDDAELKWASWEGAVGVDPTIYYIRVETVLHIRVQTRLMMDYTSSTARENKVELTLDAKKKAEQSHIDGAIGKVGMYMDSFGSAEISLQDHGAAALGNSTTNPINAFAGVTQTLPNIKSLLPDSQDAEEDDEDKDEDDENDDDDETGEEGHKNKKKKNKVMIGGPAKTSRRKRRKSCRNSSRRTRKFWLTTTSFLILSTRPLTHVYV